MKSLSEQEVQALVDFRDFISNIRRILTKTISTKKNEPIFSKMQLRKLIKSIKPVIVKMPVSYSEIHILYAISNIPDVKLIKANLAWDKNNFIRTYKPTQIFEIDDENTILIEPDSLYHINNAEVNYCVGRQVVHHTDEEKNSAFLVFASAKNIDNAIAHFKKQIEKMSPFAQKFIIIHDNSLKFINNSKLIDFKDVVLNTSVQRECDDLLSIIKNYKKIHDKCKRQKLVYLLMGPPGTGKTSTINGVIKFALNNSYTVFSVVATDYQEKSLNLAIELSKSHYPSLIVVEDFDLMGQDRYGLGRGVTSRTLQMLSGAEEEDNYIMLLSTNRFDVLDEAVKRSGRIDRKLLIDYPEESERIKLVDIFKKKYNISISTNIIWGNISPLLSQYTTGADIESIFQFCEKIAVASNRKVNILDVINATKQTTEIKKEMGFH